MQGERSNDGAADIPSVVQAGIENDSPFASVAAALGNIGPDAAAALPALQRALKMHRETYTAEEAILKIKKEPVPSWF